MKLTLRDLFWLIVVCALAVGWWGDHRRLRSREARLLERENAIAGQEQQLAEWMKEARARKAAANDSLRELQQERDKLGLPPLTVLLEANKDGQPVLVIEPRR